MKKLVKKLLSVIASMGIFMSGLGITAPNEVKAEEQQAGYLAVYVASYEYNMGMEYAQFPSNNYTDTCRTDVLYYGLSKDGVNFEGLNNNKAVYYPKGFYQLGSPSVFRKPDGTYGLIATINNSNNKIFLSDSKDLIFFDNERVKSLNTKDITVKNPTVEYSQEDSSYHIYWEGGDGNSYLTTTKDFSTFSEPQKKTSKSKIVSIDSFGMMKAKKKGTAKVKAICGKKSVTMKVKVK